MIDIIKRTLEELKPYEASGHFKMTAMRIHGKEETQASYGSVCPPSLMSPSEISRDLKHRDRFVGTHGLRLLQRGPLENAGMVGTNLIYNIHDYIHRWYCLYSRLQRLQLRVDESKHPAISLTLA